MKEYTLKSRDVLDNMFWFDILCEDTKVGVIDINVKDDYIFIRDIVIDKEYRGKGHATNTIDMLRRLYGKTIKLCISTISLSAKPFWDKYFVGKKVSCIRGNIYQIDVSLNED